MRNLWAYIAKFGLYLLDDIGCMQPVFSDGDLFFKLLPLVLKSPNPLLDVSLIGVSAPAQLLAFEYNPRAQWFLWLNLCL